MIIDKKILKDDCFSLCVWQANYANERISVSEMRSRIRKRFPKASGRKLKMFNRTIAPHLKMIFPVEMDREPGSFNSSPKKT